MKMKLIYFITAFLFIVSHAQSQYQFRTGINLANITASESAINYTSRIVSYHVGVVGDMEFSENLFLQPGLLFTGKGSQHQTGETPFDYYNSTTAPFYLEVPLNLIYKGNGDYSRFFTGGGPYIAYGIAGKTSMEGKSGGQFYSIVTPIHWTKGEATGETKADVGMTKMNRFDYGVNAIAGIDGELFTIAINYGIGLARLQPAEYTLYNSINKNRVVSFTVGIKM
jgi:hypothetical protein